MIIRPGRWSDLPQLEALYAYGRDYMRQQGNPSQWGDHYPARAQIEQDIAAGQLWIVEEAAPVGVFVLQEGAEPTYATIEAGDWLNERPYATLHRVVSRQKGCASFLLDWALARCRNLRVDTHRDNAAMQALLRRRGFAYCGVVHVADGSPRLAFQKELP